MAKESEITVNVKVSDMEKKLFRIAQCLYCAIECCDNVEKTKDVRMIVLVKNNIQEAINSLVEIVQDSDVEIDEKSKGEDSNG